MIMDDAMHWTKAQIFSRLFDERMKMWTQLDLENLTIIIIITIILILYVLFMFSNDCDLIF